MPDPVVVKILKNAKTGQMAGETSDGQRFLIKDVLKHESGAQAAVGTDGTVFRYVPQAPPKPVKTAKPGHFEMAGVEALSRFWGIIAGALNAITVAGPMGTLEGIAKRPVEGPGGGVKRLFEAVGDEGIKSALESVTQRGKWGATFNDVVVAKSGKNIFEHFAEDMKAEEDLGKRNNIYAAKMALSHVGQAVVDMIVGVSLDTAGVKAAAKGFKGLMSLSDDVLKARYGLSSKEIRRGRALANQREQLINTIKRIKESKAVKGTAVDMLDDVVKETSAQQGALDQLKLGVEALKRQQLETGFARAEAAAKQADVEQLAAAAQRLIKKKVKPTVPEGVPVAKAGMPASRIKDTTLINDKTMGQIKQQVLTGAKGLRKELSSIVKDHSVDDLRDWMNPGKMKARLYADMRAKGLPREEVNKRLTPLIKRYDEAYYDVLEKSTPAKVAAKVPEFKGTEDALEFGLKATPEQRTELQRLYKEGTEEANDLIKQKRFDEGSRAAFRAQLYNEAFNAEEIVKRHKLDIGKPAPVKDRLDLIKERAAKLKEKKAELKPLPEKVAVKPEPTAAQKVYNDLHNYYDELAGTKTEKPRKVEKGWEAGTEYPSELTFDSLGGQQMYEAGERLVKKLKAVAKQRRLGKELIGAQIQDVQDMAISAVRNEVLDAHPRVRVDAVMRQEARAQGKTLVKIKGGWALREKGKGALSFKDLDEVNRTLKTGTKTAEEYRDALWRLEVEDISEEGARSFMRWAFPEGTEKVTLKEGLDALEKFEGFLKRGPEKRRLAARRFEAPDVTLGRTPAGKEFYNIWRRAKDEKGIMLAKGWQSFMREVKKGKLSKTEINELQLALDSKPRFDPKTGKLLEVDKKVVYEDMRHLVKDKRIIDVADRVRPILDDIYAQAKASGIKVKKYLGRGYFPHRIPPIEALKVGGAKRQDILNATVREGWFRSLEEAEDVLEKFISRASGNKTDERYLRWLVEKRIVGTMSQARRWWKSFVGKRYSPVDGSLVHSRTMNVPFYDRDVLGVISSYMDGAYSGIANYKILGGEGAIKASRLIDQIKREGGNFQLAEDLLDRHLFPGRIAGMPKSVQILKGIQTITKLGPLSSFVNLTQTLAPGLRVGPRAWIRAWRRFSAEDAKSAGVALSQTLRDIEKLHTGGSRLVGNYMKAIGFVKSEEAVRIFAGNCGREAAMLNFELLQRGKRVRYCKRFFNELGLDADEMLKRGRMTERELDLVKKRVSDEVNFLGTDVDLPLKWVDDPVWALATQFKTFIYGQSKLVYRHVVKEAMRGNFRPAAFLFVAYPAVGIPFDVFVNQLILGHERPKSFAEQYIRGLLAVGGLGLMETTLYGLKYAKLPETAIGPTGSDIADTSTKIFNDSLTSRDLLRYTPFNVGRVIRAHMPYKSGRSRGRRSRSGR